MHVIHFLSTLCPKYGPTLSALFYPLHQPKLSKYHHDLTKQLALVAITRYEGNKGDCKK